MCLSILPPSSESDQVKFDSELFGFDSRRRRAVSDSLNHLVVVRVVGPSIGTMHVNMPS